MIQAERQVYLDELKTIDPDDLIYLDETGVDRKMQRSHARAPRNQRAGGRVSSGRCEHTTILAAMDGLGIGPLLVFVGFLSENIFEYFIREMLVPTLQPGNVVVMDNLPIHHTLSVIEAIEAAGARVLFTPRYSPDMNPIEEAWSTMNEYLRGIAPRTGRAEKIGLGSRGEDWRSIGG